jgi:thiol-disulfide isomerase/thioredoxin
MDTKHKSKSIRPIIFSILLSFLMLLCPGFLRAFAMDLDFVVSHFAYFFVVYFLIRKYPDQKTKIAISFISTVVLICGLICYSIGKFTIHGLPNFASIVIGCINGYLFFVITDKKRFIILMISMVLCLYYYFIGIGQWLNYEQHGSISGRVNERIQADWPSYLKTSDSIKFDSKDKFIVLDFFNTRCAACFNSFPMLQRTYDYYKSNSRVSIYAVDIPYLTDTPGMGIQLVREDGFTFPVLVGQEKSDSVFRILAYPTVIVLKDSAIIFRGSIENIDKVIGD